MLPTVFVFSLGTVQSFSSNFGTVQRVSLASAAETLYGWIPDILQLIAHSLPCFSQVRACVGGWCFG